MQLTPEEVHVLVTLSQAEGTEMSADELASALAMKQDVVVTMLGRLARASMVIPLGKGYMLDQAGREFLTHPPPRD